MSDVEEYRPELFDLDPHKLLRAIKFRRSVRDFQSKGVEADKIKDIINAGRCSPSASNRQDYHFYVIQERLRDFKKIIWDLLEKQLAGKVNMPRDMLRPVSRFYDMRQKNPDHDYLFRNAPVVLFIECNTELDAGVAAQNMELTAVAHGLGVMYDQYLSFVTKINREALQFLGTHGDNFLVAMLLGYPAVTFARTAPRKNTNITWK
ncbi:MAG: nitroreductase family protein [Planctomycetes bacterium]|nr:nitroreductase family protein [Planctomycetota bacterium]